jgi:hypothetical protein
MRFLAIALVLAGCKDDLEGTPGPIPTVTDTGWFETDTDLPGCTATVVETEPTPGQVGWYWRDAPRVFVTEADQTAFTAAIYGPSGQPVETTVTWGAGLSFDVGFAGGLEPNADQILEITDCSGITRIPFHTSSFGLPLIDGPSSLDGRTWQLDLGNATWVEPSDLGAFLGQSFTTPVLLGVRFATDELIDLLGAPGLVTSDGVIQSTAPTWEFPATDFTEAPFVAATSDNVVFEYQGNAVPIEDFRFETTFSADGASLGGTVLTGVADTRNLGGFVQDEGNPAAICELAASIGTDCVPCNDSLPYCLVMQVRDVSGTLIPGLTLRTIE